MKKELKTLKDLESEFGGYLDLLDKVVSKGLFEKIPSNLLKKLDLDEQASVEAGLLEMEDLKCKK